MYHVPKMVRYTFGTPRAVNYEYHSSFTRQPLMCIVLFLTPTGLAAVSDPNDWYSHLPRPVLPPMPKELFLFLGLAPTLQHLVETALAGECGAFYGFQRIHLN